MNINQQRNVCIIGAGPLGLSAAYYLSRECRHQGRISVTLLESASSSGGLAASHTLTNGKRIESYYHHIFTTDSHFIELSRDLEVFHEINFRSATVGHFYMRNLYKLGGPLDILLGGLLSPLSRARFLAASLFLKIGLEKRFAGVNALEGSQKLYGTEATKKIWLPLLQGKFNRSCDDVPMSWLASRIRDRSIKLGYYRDGFHRFYETLTNACLNQGVDICYGTKVETLKVHSNYVTINGRTYDACLSTVGPVIEDSLGVAGEKNRIRYLGAICVVFELDTNPQLPYWTNYCDSSSPVLAVINHRELENSERFGGCFPVYTAAYLEPDHPLFEADDKDIISLFFEPIRKIARAGKLNDLAGFQRATVYRSRYAQPIINPDIGLKPLINYTGPAYSASMHSIYPNDRGQNYAIQLGKKMAAKINADLNQNS